MKKTFISTVSLALVFSMALSFASCGGDDDTTADSASTSAQTNSTQTSVDQTEKATEIAKTDTPDVTEPIEDPATDAAVTDAPVTDAPATDAPATKAPATKAPETDAPATKAPATKAPETSAPVEDTTKTPETEAPVEDTTSEVTTKPEEETTAPATTAPGQDPNVDYSEWGKHGFENLLPIPLPFSDEEADWKSKKESSTYFKVKNFKMIYFENSDAFVSAVKAYAESYESLGYTLKLDQYVFTVYSETELFTLRCNANGYCSVDIYII